MTIGYRDRGEVLRRGDPAPAAPPPLSDFRPSIASGYLRYAAILNAQPTAPSRLRLGIGFLFLLVR